MRRLGLAAILVTLFIAGGLSHGAVPKKKLPSDFFGVVPNTSLDSGDFARMTRAHVGTMRFGLLWSAVQSSRHSGLNFSGYDSGVEAAAEAGIHMLPVMVTPPEFDYGHCSGPTCARRPPHGRRALKDWKAFLIGAVQRYGPHGSFWQGNSFYEPITKWQIWNEQNNGVADAPAKRFAKFMKISAKAIHSVEPKAKVMLGGMFGSPPEGGTALAWRYLDNLYKAGAKPYFDGVALHPYAPRISGIASQVKHMRRVMERHHDGSTPLYVTEIGWGSSKKKHAGTGGRGAAFNVGAKKQRKNLKAAYKLLLRHRADWNIGGIDWFTWKDPANAPAGLCAFCYSSGLYKSDGKTPKPALGAFRHFAKLAQ